MGEKLHVLYDRESRRAVAAKEALVHHATDGGTATRYFSLPFLPLSENLCTGDKHMERSYVQNMMLAIGTYNVPRGLQAIISDCDLATDNDSSELSVLLNKLIPHCNIMCTNRCLVVERVVTANINRLLVKLRETNLPIFDGITAVMLGSAAEKTKTFQPDEWDFVIFLPYFWNKQREQFLASPSSVQLTQDIQHEVKSMLMDVDDNVNKCECIVEILHRIVIKYLSTSIQGLEFKYACTNHNKALPVFFRYETLEIKLDVSFGVRHEDEQYTTNEPLLHHLEKQRLCPFFIFVDQMDQTSFIATLTFKEVIHMVSLPNDVRTCYQLSKSLIEYLIPSYGGHGTRCKHTVFPSYRLKLILFHMHGYYNDGRYWSRGQWCSRILEMFIIYSMCLRYGTLYNLFSFTSQLDIGEDIESIGEYVPLCMFHVEEYLSRLPATANVCKATEKFCNVFLQADNYTNLYNGDIVSEFCALLCSMSYQDFEKGDDAVSSPPDVNVSEEFRFGPNEDDKPRGISTFQNDETDLHLTQRIRMEAQVTCIAIPPDHDGEWLIGLDNKKLIKYQYNEVIQQIQLPDYPRDMCYHNNTVTIIIHDHLFDYSKVRDTRVNRLVTYNYTELSQQSFLWPKQYGLCTAITPLDDGFVLAFHKMPEIIKMTSDGEIACSSPKIFESPSQIVVVENTIIVYDDDLESLTALSGDLESTLFVYPPRDLAPTSVDSKLCLFGTKPMCSNGVTRSLFACCGYRCILEIGDTGDVMRLLHTPCYMSYSSRLVHDKFRQSLVICEQRTILVFRLQN